MHETLKHRRENGVLRAYDAVFDFVAFLLHVCMIAYCSSGEEKKNLRGTNVPQQQLLHPREKSPRGLTV